MDENWYTNESVWSLSFFYPDPQEDLGKKKKKKQPKRLFFLFHLPADGEK